METPSYVVINDDTQPEDRRQVLRTVSRELTFPLSDEDREMIDILEEKFDNEENCAGLAAPQIGFGIKAIVFSCPLDPTLMKFRKDLEQSMEKTIWINPTYEGVGEDMTEDYEACFSVADIAGPVNRYTHVRYQACLIDGTKVEGEASGFLARIIQHEVDHLNGTLCIDKVPEGKLTTIEEIRAQRRAILEREAAEANEGK